MRSTDRDELGRRAIPNDPGTLNPAPLFTDAAIQTRREWWAGGARGHYPGCTCGRCQPRAAATDDEIRDAFALVAPMRPPRPADHSGYRRRTIVTRRRGYLSANAVELFDELGGRRTVDVETGEVL